MNDSQKYGMLITIINRTPTVLQTGDVRSISDVNSDIEKEYDFCKKLFEKN